MSVCVCAAAKTIHLVSSVFVFALLPTSSWSPTHKVLRGGATRPVAQLAYSSRSTCTACFVLYFCDKADTPSPVPFCSHFPVVSNVCLFIPLPRTTYQPLILSVRLSTRVVRTRAHIQSWKKIAFPGCELFLFVPYCTCRHLVWGAGHGCLHGTARRAVHAVANSEKSFKKPWVTLKTKTVFAGKRDTFWQAHCCGSYEDRVLHANLELQFLF